MVAVGFLCCLPECSFSIIVRTYSSIVSWLWPRCDFKMYHNQAKQFICIFTLSYILLASSLVASFIDCIIARSFEGNRYIVRFRASFRQQRAYGRGELVSID